MGPRWQDHAAHVRAGSKISIIPWTKLHSGKLLCAAAALVIASATETAAGERAIASGVAAAARAADLIAARSPGMRTGETLTKKPRPELGRIARALPKIRNLARKPEAEAPPHFAPAAAAVPEGYPLLPEGVAPPFAFGPIPGAIMPEGPIWIGFFPGYPWGGGPVGPIGPIIGPGGGGPIVTPTPTPTPPAAVPEPALWATLLLGFGTIGAALRTKRYAGLSNAA